MSLDTFLSTLQLGLIYSVLALGLFLSFRILDTPDLTVDGSFVTGMAISAGADAGRTSDTGTGRGVCGRLRRRPGHRPASYTVKNPTDSGRHSDNDGAVFRQPENHGGQTEFVTL